MEELTPLQLESVAENRGATRKRGDSIYVRMSRRVFNHVVIVEACYDRSNS